MRLYKARHPGLTLLAVAGEQGGGGGGRGKAGEGEKRRDEAITNTRLPLHKVSSSQLCVSEGFYAFLLLLWNR